MSHYILLGAGFAFAAAVQPGPLQAFLFASVARIGWKRTLPACFSPLISDGPVALLTLLVLDRVSEWMRLALQTAGGVFLLYLAWSGYRQWKHQREKAPESEASVPRTLLQAATVNILNPNPYLGWSLVLGPALLAAWRESPGTGIALLVVFYATMISVTAGTVVLFGTTRFLKPGVRRALVLVSALMLALLGVFQVARSLLLD